MDKEGADSFLPDPEVEKMLQTISKQLGKSWKEIFSSATLVGIVVGDDAAVLRMQSAPKRNKENPVTILIVYKVALIEHEITLKFFFDSKQKRHAWV